MQVMRRGVAVGSVLTVLLASSVPAATGIEDIEQELDDAVRTLEDIEAALQAAEREIVAAEARLRDAEAALDEVAAELEVARAAVADAEETRRARTQALEAAEQHLADTVAVSDDATRRLQDRSVEVFKYGAGREQQALVSGLIGAADWHEVAVSTSTVTRVVVSDRELLEDAVRAREAAAAALVIANDARVAAVAAEQEAIARGAQLEAKVEEHEAAVAAVEEEHQRRQAMVEELEADSELMATLVAKLEDELARAVRAAEEAAARDAAAREAAAREAEEAAEQQRQREAREAEEDAEPVEDDPTDEDVDPEPAPPEPPPAAGAWAAKLPAAGQPWAGPIEHAASSNGVDPRLFAALVWTESAFDPAAVSRVGAIGLAQLMPLTAASLGVDPWDPIQNLDGGARYLAAQYARFGSLELALAAYNAGPTAVQNAGPGIPNYFETQMYVLRVLERYNVLLAS